MRFKFCGDDDCPDWLLGQVSNLSKLSHIKLKLLLQTIVKNILAGEVDYEKIQKFTADAKFSDTEVKGCVAALTFLLSNSVKFSVEASHLNNELQQIGFPKEHAQVITTAFKDSYSSLSNHFISSILKINAISSIKCSRINENYVKLVLGLSNSGNPSGSVGNSGTANGMDSTSDVVSHTFVLGEKQYTLLLQELISVQKRIEEMSSS